MTALSGGEFGAVMHFAASKSIPEGEADPVGYYQSNCSELINIVAARNFWPVRCAQIQNSQAVGRATACWRCWQVMGRFAGRIWLIRLSSADPVISCADVSLARGVLGFETCHDLRAMYESNWAFSGKAGS